MDPKDIPIRDLHLPAEVGWWPLAPGWWILIGIATVLLVSGLVLGIIRYREGRARRYALRELKAYASAYRKDGDPRQLGAQLSALTRRTVLAYAPRSDVAGLTGDVWAQWLDRGLPQPLFSAGPGRLLLELPYRNPEDVADADVGKLIDAVRLRLKTPVEVDA